MTTTRTRTRARTARRGAPLAGHVRKPAPAAATGPHEAVWQIGAYAWRLCVWTDAEWAALAPTDRPAQSAPLPGIGRIAVVLDPAASEAQRRRREAHRAALVAEMGEEAVFDMERLEAARSAV